jgi:membrane-associated phospholipid phosphatase
MHTPSLAAGTAQARRPVVWLSVGLLAWTALFVMVATAEGLAEEDRPVLRWLTAHRHPAVTWLMRLVSSPAVAVLVPVAVVAATLAVGAVQRTWRPLVTVVLAFGGASVLSWGTKTLVRRPRPPAEDMLGSPASGWSFPSGHTLLTSALLGSLVLLFWARTTGPVVRSATMTAAVAAALLMGLSRMYLGDHWLTDVLASYALAVSVLAATAAAVGARRWATDQPQPQPPAVP